MKKFFIAGVSCLVIALFAVLTMSFKVSQTELCSGCIDFAGNAYDDGDCIASVTLTPSCQFLFTNKEESPYEYIRGTYSIDGVIERGGQCTIKIYIDGEPTEYGTIMWPMEDNKIFLSLGDYLFY